MQWTKSKGRNQAPLRKGPGTVPVQRTEEAVKAATMFVSIGPIILVYPFIQRYFVKGIMVGAVKG